MHVFTFHEPLLPDNFRVSGNFPETAWRAMHSRQVTLMFVMILSFWWIAWRWWIPAKRHEPILARFWYFMGSG